MISVRFMLLFAVFFSVAHAKKTEKSFFYLICSRMPINFADSPDDGVGSMP